MDRHPPHHRSQLFTIRLWQEEVSSGQAEWRGQVQHVTTGETIYVRDWLTLVHTLVTMLQRERTEPP